MPAHSPAAPTPFNLSRRGLGLALAGSALAAPTARAAAAGWNVEVFRRYWAHPSAELTRRAKYYPGLVAHWPFAAQPLVGPELYIKAVTKLLELIPDIRLTVEDSCELDDIHFVRWSARGTPVVGAREWSGAGCVRTRDGEMIENWIFSEHPVFERMLREI